MVISIDPGLSGGIASFSQERGYPLVCSMPDTEADIIDSIAYQSWQEPNLIAYVESVHSFPGQGVASSFTFGRHFGFLLGTLQTQKIPVVLVSPQKWQKHFGLTNVGQKLTKTEHKNKLKSEAQRLFPNLKVTLKTCDALLILKYAIEKEKI